MTLSVLDILVIGLLSLILAASLDRIEDKLEENAVEMAFVLKVQRTAYEKGHKEGLEHGSVSTVYLCRDWVPLLGYKAWRQCNMGYMKYTGEEDKL